MRDEIRVQKAAGALQRWLRRAALSAAIPALGMSGCGKQCNNPDAQYPVQVDAGISWAVGTTQPRDACLAYCHDVSDVCYRQAVNWCVATSQTTLTCNLEWTYCAQSPCGRNPPALKVDRPSREPSLLAAHLAGAARLERAAVLAFGVLERELAAHRAPAELIARARAAQDDERRHHAAMSDLAARLGAQAGRVASGRVPVRTLFEIAVENAVEGCVRETYGAAVAVFQGEHAGDSAIAGAMRSIAPDEAEHASLAWAVDGWARSRLSRRERAAVDDARSAALIALAHEVRRPVPADLVCHAGVPGAEASRRLIEALQPLWA